MYIYMYIYIYIHIYIICIYVYIYIYIQRCTQFSCALLVRRRNTDAEGALSRWAHKTRFTCALLVLQNKY